MSTPDNRKEKLSYKPRDIWARFGWVEKIGSIVFALVGLLIIYVLTIQPLIENAGDNSDMARVQCEQAVERQLKAPASARHSHTPSVIETGDEEWRVTSFTDAQNSFGAMIRNEWTCNVAYYEVLETWQTSIEFAD